MPRRIAMLCTALAALRAAPGPGLLAGESGPGFQWPAFQDIRYREDWCGTAGLPSSGLGREDTAGTSRTAGQASRATCAPSDWADPIKYVPLSPDGSAWASSGGYSHFFPGTFIKQSGAHEDTDFTYLIWQFTF